MYLFNKSYTKEDINHAQKRGKRIGTVIGIEDLETRLVETFRDHPESVEVIKSEALELKRNVEKKGL